MTLSVIVFDCMIIEEREVYRMRDETITSVMLVLVLTGLLPFLACVVLIGLLGVLIG